VTIRRHLDRKLPPCQARIRDRLSYHHAIPLRPKMVYKDDCQNALHPKVMKTIQDHEDTWNYAIEPLVDHGTLTAYERLNNAAAISRAVYTHGNEAVLVRNSFHWKKDGQTIPEAHASMSMKQVCKAHRWKIVERYGEHLAIVAPV
jgi:hypothetical protein